MASGLVFNIQRYSVHDGPGIRTTVFLKGCPLRCLWCHNPEGIVSNSEIVVFESRCVSCGVCVAVCPVLTEKREVGADFKNVDFKVFLGYPSECRLCGRCVESCATGARQIVGRKFSVHQLVQEVLKDRMFFEESCGGVTFSGGEPLAQPEFVIETIIGLRKHEIHTAIDTCGFAPHEVIREVSKLADLFLFDLKFISPHKHRKFTSANNELIIENLALLNQLHKNIWLRIPIIPGANANYGEIDAIAKFIKPLKSIRQINLLPYHNTGVYKVRRFRQRSDYVEFQEPTTEQLELIKNKLSFLNIPVKIGG